MELSIRPNLIVLWWYQGLNYASKSVLQAITLPLGLIVAFRPAHPNPTPPTSHVAEAQPTLIIQSG